MHDLLVTLIIGFGITAYLLYAVISTLEDLRKSLVDRSEKIENTLGSIHYTLGAIEKEVGWKGTIHKQLLDIEKAVRSN